jgi:hypothetical protein
MTDRLPAGEPVGAMEGTRLPGDSRKRGIVMRCIILWSGGLGFGTGSQVHP